jgi:hypothetical protein
LHANLEGVADPVVYQRSSLSPNFRAKWAGSHPRASSENAGDLS